MRALLLFLAWLAAANLAHADTLAVVNAHIYTMGKAGEIKNGTIVVANGRITAVGTNVAVPKNARIIDAKGAPVTPGIFVAGTNLGSVEVDLETSANDGATSSATISAAFDVAHGIDPNATTLPRARAGGVTHALVTPGYAGGDGRELLFAGRAALVALDASRPPVVRARAAMMLELGEGGAARAGGARGSSIEALKADLDDVRWYARNRGRYNTGASRELRLSNADLAALLPVVQKRMPLIVRVHRAADITAILAFAKQQGLRIVLSGAEEGWMVAREIAAARVPVILGANDNLPGSFETLGATMENAARLHAAGVTIAFSNGEDGHRIREVRYDAGNAVAQGLPYGAALAAITINPARIFGMAGTAGSLERGKQANLVVWSGDPLEPMTQAQTVIIAGREQPLTSRAEDLARRYKDLTGPLPQAYKQ
ncbi:MAG: amidohydrolase family protein [Alphaproteobacteria bacterium]|nr:amidohydrolase family protein [Alphaproteobacteria bacterium]